MPQSDSFDRSGALALIAQPLLNRPGDYDALLESIGDAGLVLIGEASHGTHEFYQERALITRRLVREKGFQAVAVEADWADASKVNRFVKSDGDVLEGADPLSGFKRFPQWMWRNAEMLDFAIWLRQWNDALPAGGARCGFYGLDLYGMQASIDAILRYLDRADPEAAMRARIRYSCFEYARLDPTQYGQETSLGLTESCEREALDQLLELRRMASERPAQADPLEGDDLFEAEQNARLIVNAEEYYRNMFRGHADTWNLRDRHMADTLDELAAHLGKRSGLPGRAKIVVWAHNSHIGDARATGFAEQGELNLGQLMRERHGKQAFLLGMTTYTGTVLAASDWGAAAEPTRVRPALPGSYEAIFHDTGIERFLLDLRTDNDVITALAEPRLHRAIGVIYRPETERISHYFSTRIPAQYDALLHFDHTTPVDTLGPPVTIIGDEVPETFPSTV
jgi:erythromycin esterase-like protein